MFSAASANRAKNAGVLCKAGGGPKGETEPRRDGSGSMLGQESPLEAVVMTTVSANDARDNLHRLIDEAAASHEPLLIAGERHSAVLVSAEDWDAIQETLHLLSIPGMRESIREGLATPPGECSREPSW